MPDNNFGPERVMFRKYLVDDDIFALFPDMHEDGDDLVTCYQHIGQHGIGSLILSMEASIPATPEEYADLEKELEQRGYTLIVVSQITELTMHSLVSELQYWKNVAENILTEEQLDAHMPRFTGGSPRDRLLITDAIMSQGRSELKKMKAAK